MRAEAGAMNDPTPTHTYTRRRTEEVPADRLTDFRLKQLEDAVSRCGESSDQVLIEVRDMSARLAVGTERFGNLNKRIDNVEGAQRWAVIAMLSAFGSLVWQAITSLLHIGPKLIVLMSTLALAGCWPWGSVRGPCESGNVPTVGCTIGGIGSWFTWVGGVALGLAALALAASFFPAIALVATPFRIYLIEAIALSFACVLVGSALLFLGAHPWLLGVALGVVVLGLCWRYRARLRRLLGLGPAKVIHG